MSLTIQLDHHSSTIRTGQSLFECAEKLDVKIPTSCNQNGKCRECLVEVTKGMEYLTPKTEEEKHLRGNFRLSCCTCINADKGHIEYNTLKRGNIKIETKGNNIPSLINDIAFDPAVTRKDNVVYIDKIAVAESSKSILGLAVDLGTTTIVMRVIDLESKKLLAETSFENPQRFGGSDVMARIAYDTENKGRLLQRTLIAYMTHHLNDLPIDPKDIFEVIIAGNTTMRDLFFGLPVDTIGQKPYYSITEHEMRDGKRKTTTIAITGKKSRLPIHPEARVLGLPLVSSHIGADTTACLLAINLKNEDKMIAIMDIGTNTELVCGNKERAIAASCPAGPAFEGGIISCGMPGMEGAIECISINDNKQIEYRVIGETKPSGICGSGLIELLQQLLDKNIIDSFGRYTDDSGTFQIVPEENIYLTENDISELAQAKGANVAGLQILLQHYEIEIEDLDCFYFAGGFARYIDIDAARQIGLIPNLPDFKIKKIGNASIEGATIALCSISQRKAIENFVKNIQHVELETDPNFFDHFVEGCQFKLMESTVVRET